MSNLITDSSVLLGLLESPWQWALVVALILLLFGGKKLPELARGLGRGLREFRNELRGVKEDIEVLDQTPPAPPEAPKTPEQDKTENKPPSA